MASDRCDAECVAPVLECDAEQTGRQVLPHTVQVNSSDVIVCLHVEEGKKQTAKVGDEGLYNINVYQRNESIHTLKAFTLFLE